MKRLISAAILLGLIGCGGGSSTPTQPSTPPARASITIVNFGVTGSASSTEYRYAIPFSLQNTGGATATITSIVFRLTLPGGQTGTATLTPNDLFGSATLGAGASTSRPNVNLVDTTDHPFATSVGVVVTYGDAAGTNTATQSADVPPLPEPPLPAVTYSLSGTVVDGSLGLSSARVEVTTGPDSGTAVLTDGAGRFTFPALQPGSFTLVVLKSGYANLQQSVTLSATRTGLTLTLTKTSTPPPPPQSLCAPATASCGAATARCNDGTLSCSQNRSGTCSSHGGVSCFICPGTLCNGLTAATERLWTPAPVPFTPASQVAR